MTNHYTNRAERRTVALACRILALQGLAPGLLGHVSLRVGEDRVLIRCRGPRERGLLFTTPDDVHLVGLDGTGDLADGYTLPHEFWIHSELLRARPEVGAVVHAHPREVVVGELAGLELRPVVGAYEIPVWRMAAGGVPIYPRAVLIRTQELGRELAETMGSSAVCLLHGHGIATVGSGVEQAVTAALGLHELARLTVALAGVGARPEAISADDAAELPDLGGAFNDEARWRLEVGRLELAGLAVPETAGAATDVDL